MRDHLSALTACWAGPVHDNGWHTREESNLDVLALETSALPVELRASVVQSGAV